MISIVICSREPNLPMGLRDNIVKTIGCEYELVIVDNSHNKYNIFQAYNEGVNRSKGDILCFMHDDVMFHSENWGKRVREYFDFYPNLGCLGVAGSHLLLDTPSSFWHSEANSLHYYDRDEKGGLLLIDSGAKKEDKDFEEVASIDGLWMSIRRSLFETIGFDDEVFHGFHCYDSDICMQILRMGYNIGVAYDVLIEHSGLGVQNDSYFESIRLWHQKWTGWLPIARGAEFSDEDIATRTTFVKNIVLLEERVANLKKIYNTKAYRLGRAILKPFKKMGTLMFFV